MIHQILPQPAGNGQEPLSKKSNPDLASGGAAAHLPTGCISTRQALSIARQACSALLYGEPDPVTFDVADLELTAHKLGWMLAELEAGDGERVFPENRKDESNDN